MMGLGISGRDDSKSRMSLSSADSLICRAIADGLDKALA